jgi:threonine-phosphate decarboxylase
MRKIPSPLMDPAPLFRHGGGQVARSVLDFSVNVNPLGPPASVLQALRRELPAIARYPDAECRRLTRRLADRHGVEPDRVVVGNGSNELIHALPRACRPRRVAIAEPTYTEYLRASLLAGAAVEHWLAEGDDFQPAPFDPQGADLVWLCNPNNPTGRRWPDAARLAAWVAAFPHSLFAADEAFLDFDPDGDAAHSLIPHTARLPNLVVLRSLTKFYALPGLRLGYAVAGPDLARRLRTQLVPWSVNVLAQAAGLAALEDADYRARTRAWFHAEKANFSARLTASGAGLQPVSSQANFVLVRLGRMTAAGLTGRLAERGIAVRDASNFIGLDDRYVRVAVRTAEENGKFFQELQAVLGG